MGTKLKVLLATAVCLAIVPARGADEAVEGLYRSLLEANHDAKSQALEKQILLLDGQWQALESTSKEALEADETRHRDSGRKLLETLARSPDPSVAAEALFRLAVVEKENNPGKSLSHARDASLKSRQIKGSAPIFRAKIHLLAGELLLASQKRGEAREEFALARQAATNTEEKIRAHIGIADASFVEYKFEEAQLHLAEANKALRDAAPGESSAVTPLRYPLAVRTIWAHFRGGRYNDTLTAIDDYFRLRPHLGRNASEAVENDIVRSGGVSLYEKNDVTACVRAAREPLAGSLGRRMVLAALETYVRAGRSEEVEPIGAQVERWFVTSPQFMELLAVRHRAAESSGDVELRHDLAARMATELAVGSVWHKTTALSAPEENRRRQLVIQGAEEAGEHFLRSGRRNRSRSDSLKSAASLAARLAEHADGENRGSLLLRAADAALAAGDTQGAGKFATQALAEPLSDAERKNALHTLTATTRQAAADATVATSPAFRRYIEAVDAYFKTFPSEPSARAAQYESAREARARGARALARERLEQLLAEPSTFHDAEELQRSVEFLISLHAADEDTRQASVALEDLERRLRQAGRDGDLLKAAATANAAALRRHAARLRSDGHLSEAAERQVQWARHNTRNDEAPFILLDALRLQVEIGDWARAVGASELLEASFPLHPLSWESRYWKGRALEADLSFLSAAGAFVKSAYDDGSQIPRELRVDALRRARDIFHELGDRAWEGATGEKLGSLQAALGNKRESGLARLAAGRAFLAAKNTSRAETLFLSAARESALSQTRRWEAELGALEARMADGYRNRSARIALGDFAQKMTREIKKGGLPEATKLMERALALAIGENHDEALRIRCVSLGSWDAKACARLDEVQKDARRLAARGVPHLDAEAGARLRIAAERVRRHWCDELTRAAAISGGLPQDRRDAMLETAERNRLEMRYELSSALGPLPEAHGLRIEAARLQVSTLSAGALPEVSTVAESGEPMAKNLFGETRRAP